MGGVVKDHLAFNPLGRYMQGYRIYDSYGCGASVTANGGGPAMSGGGLYLSEL